MTKYRAGTVLPFEEGAVRIERVHMRNSGPTYDIVRLSNGKRSPEYLEGMLNEGLRKGARFNRDDRALWKNRPCRVADRTWSVPSQCVHYTIQLEDRTEPVTGVREHELSVA